MKDHAIEIRGLEKRFPTFQLGPIDLSVPTGAIYGLIGPNGAGKTTTIDLLFGMGRKDAGSIRVLGLDHMQGEVEMKRQVGYVSPDLNYQAWGRVEKAIRFVRGFYDTWDDQYCERLMTVFRLGCDEKISALSFGARIKLSLVLALSWKPRLLVLDEPTVGLDAVSRQQVFTELLTAVREEKRTVLISSHSLHDLERFADHVGMIKNGRMLLEGQTSEVVEAFRMADLEVTPGNRLPAMEGWHVQNQDGDRVRALIDTRLHDLNQLGRRGIRLLSSTPVSLEDLFVGLAKD
jgi:ABC-2 type transport system ATP-binding protein